MALHIALIQPQIPPNTGNIARLCAATDSSLHLIEPLGFSIDAPDVRRAGLDYWDAVDLWVHPDWFAFRDAMDRSRCLYFSANAERSYWEAPYRPNSCLVFGSETEGMPPRILEKHPERCFTIPMSGPVRSLNLSTAVGIVLYEALRQTGAGESSADPRRPPGRAASRTQRNPSLATDQPGS
jgi:tRNA (cytidine/uridine-2'-O-)-methyltransferase